MNSRGDVEAIHDVNGNLVARYLYDSWGTVIAVVDADGNEITDTANIGHVNRIRYRGYYYDVETGFYYVSSRYYDPEVGRFISADTTNVLTFDGTSILQKNLYAYCENDPVNCCDVEGYFAIPALVVKVAWIALDVFLNLGITWVTAKTMGQELSKKDLIKTAAITVIGSMSFMDDVILAVWSGMDTVSSTYESGKNIETALLAGVTAGVATYAGINSLVSRHTDEIMNLTSAACVATFGLGENLVATATVVSIEQNGKPQKATWINMRRRTHRYYNYSDLNYIKVRNGRLMK